MFRPEIIGKEMLESFIMLCNDVKSQLALPEFLLFTDVTSIYKKKGDKNDLDNDRGLFGVS